VQSREAYVILNLLPGIGPVRVTTLLSLFGSPEAILRSPQQDIGRVRGIGERLSTAIHNWRDHCDPEAELRLAEKAGVSVITLADEEYPRLLREIHDPPLCLYVRGDPGALASLESSVAIVGSRRTTRYGIRTAEHLATEAAFAGWTVVSGMARGIDTVAHQATIRAKGVTVAVLGSGLQHIYPQENLDLAKAIATHGGALISEFPMAFPPDRRTFPMRNRIISGMTRGTIVVEAGARSGSLITATQAMEQGRTVFAVPGPIDSPQSKGCNQLIKDGAPLIESFADVLDDFTLLLPRSAAQRSQRTGAVPQSASTDDATADSAAGNLKLTGLEAKLIGFLGTDEVGIDELIAHLGEAPGKVLSTVVMLEMRHLLKQLPGRRVVRIDRTTTV